MRTTGARRWAAAIAAAAALASASCDSSASLPAKAVETGSEQPTTSPTPTSEPRSARSTMLFVGTVFWGRYVDDWAHANPLGVRHPFSRLGEFQRDRYDAWIGGLECPTVAGLDVSSAEQDRLLSFNCDPAFLPEASRWFTAFSLANNHTGNQGRAGVRETRDQLIRHGVQHFGDPDPRRLDDACNVVTVPVRVQLADGSADDGRLPLAMCGFDGVFRIPPPAAAARLRTHAAYLPTFALPHNGLEYTSTPDSIKVDFARDLVDAGADAVLGDHPHWIQRAETWRGRLIVHSLGNFMFDQQGDGEVTRSAAIRVVLDVTAADGLDAWLALGETCAQRQGDCLAEIQAAGLPKPAYTLRFEVVGSTNTGGLTRPASPSQVAAIRQRLRWSEVTKGLRPPSSAR